MVARRSFPSGMPFLLSTKCWFRGVQGILIALFGFHKWWMIRCPDFRCADGLESRCLLPIQKLMRPGSIRFKWHLDSFFKFGWSLGDYTVVAQQRWECCITDEPHGLKTKRRPNNRVRGKSPKRWSLQLGDTSSHSPAHCQNLEIFLIFFSLDDDSCPAQAHKDLKGVCKDCKFTIWR